MCLFYPSIDINCVMFDLCVIILTLIPILEVHESWKDRLSATIPSHKLEAYCNQVKRCIEIALDCLKSNRQERPTIKHIVACLKEKDTMVGHRWMQTIKKFHNTFY